MAKSYRASQYDSAYIPKLLRNWEIPHFHCEIPVARLGKTQIIANKRGHLLPEIPHPPPTPWGTNLDTWDLPRRITREVAAQLNGMNERKKLIEKCKKRLNQKPIVHGDGQFIKHYDDEEEEDKTPEHLCPIHDIKVEYI
ncbi:protein Flattop [Diorhabda carinulata]|uniref:protein Flattop n=1 Tax=Diorhabda carinulata TaxID=1163345 RepID=UPI0025A1AF1E|nr:protein Flattop [Diorhabda carinulata]